MTLYLSLLMPTLSPSCSPQPTGQTSHSSQLKSLPVYLYVIQYILCLLIDEQAKIQNEQLIIRNETDNTFQGAR